MDVDFPTDSSAGSVAQTELVFADPPLFTDNNSGTMEWDFGNASFGNNVVP
jgi:hypothetical protein